MLLLLLVCVGLVFGGLLGGGFLRGDGPRGDDVVCAGIGDQLAHMLVGISDEDVDNITFVGLGAEFGKELGELGVGHGADGGLGEVLGFFQFSDDLGFIGGCFFVGLVVESCGRGGAAQGENLVALARDMEEDFRERAGVGGRAPVEFV